MPQPTGFSPNDFMSGIEAMGGLGKRNKYSLSIFLDVDIKALNKRLKNSQKRPLLKDRNILTTLKELDKQRRKYYLNADIKIDTTSSPEITLLTFKKIFLSTYD